MPLFQRLLLRWPVFMAIAVSAFTLILLFSLYSAQSRLHTATDARLVADSHRRAAAVSDFVAERRLDVGDLAGGREIEAFLVNRALGMSPQYGLNTNLDAIERRFQQQIEQKTLRGQSVYTRIYFKSEDGAILAQAGKDALGDSMLNGGKDAAQLRIDTKSGRMYASAPVVFKGAYSGTVVTMTDLRVLSLLLIATGKATDAADAYQEFLLTEQGRGILAPAQSIPLTEVMGRSLAMLPEDKLVPTAEIAGAERFRDMLALRTSIPGSSLSMLTITSETDAYGQLASPAYVLYLGAFAAALLLAAVGFDRMRRRAIQLQNDYATSDLHRTELEQRNRNLSEEIARRKEVEAALSRKTEELDRLNADLSANRERLDFALQGANDGLWDWNLQTGEALYSKRWKEMLGYAENEIPNESSEWSNRVHPEDLPHTMARIQAHIDGKTPTAEVELRMLCKDGSWKWILGRGKVVSRSSDGKPLRIVGTNTDVTDRKHAEALLKEKMAQLEESESRLARAMEATSDGLWEWDLVSGRGYFSPAYYRMLGCEEGDFDSSAAAWMDRLHPEDKDRALAANQDCIDNRAESFATEFRMRTKDGGWRWILGRGKAVVRDSRGKALRMIGTHVDITERKQAEAERARLEAQLRESQKMEALGTMAGGVAHDFNNALAMIIGNAELARQDAGPGHPALVSLDEIDKAGRRAKDLVQQILSFGRRQNLERKATSLALVVVETERLVRATLPAAVGLKVNCAADAPAVLADATQIKQVLLNLCGNALAAVRDRGHDGVIEVGLRAYVHEDGATHADLQPGRYACLTVRDNGSGMDEATRLRIFEPFFTTKPVGQGTGLGLAVVHGIAQAHAAIVEVESAPGEGSAFSIYFPAIDAPAADAEPAKAEVAPVHGAGKRVLYVDDEEAIIFLMKRLLERRGFRVSGYTMPEEALAAVKNAPYDFDLAVTDYSMPGMSGLELAEALRAIRGDLPIVLASGYITEDLRRRAPAAGVRELIHKPNTVDDLCDAVARCANAQIKPNP